MEDSISQDLWKCCYTVYYLSIIPQLSSEKTPPKPDFDTPMQTQTWKFKNADLHVWE